MISLIQKFRNRTKIRNGHDILNKKSKLNNNSLWLQYFWFKNYDILQKFYMATISLTQKFQNRTKILNNYCLICIIKNYPLFKNYEFRRKFYMAIISLFKKFRNWTKILNDHNTLKLRLSLPWQLHLQQNIDIVYKLGHIIIENHGDNIFFLQRYKIRLLEMAF